MPNLITASGPGDLYTVRNVGNLVPAPDDPDGSVGAAIEYAINVLRVPSIVVCGHSRCGAMQALLGRTHREPEDVETPYIRRWLAKGDTSLRRAHAELTALPTAEALRRLARANVVE